MDRSFRADLNLKSARLCGPVRMLLAGAVLQMR